MIQSTASLFPFGVLIGALILYNHRDESGALAAAPFVSPFVNVTSWIAVLPLLAQQSRRVVIVSSLLSWLLFAIWVIHGHVG